ncbi:MAG: FemAB family PEP-CTERM system-associated protein [Candidatus Thiodiazotropha lotti]|nr:FemAB family PEP-CTERM system-associated protein [Candidatus Thiodiazotropha lotti]
MSISLRIAGDGDKGKWDEYVKRHQSASPYHLYSWKTAIEVSYRHKAYYILAEEDNNIVGVLPLVQLKLPIYLNNLVSLPFCDVGGVISDSEQIQDELLAYILKLKSELKINSIELRGDLARNTDNENFLHQDDTDKVRMMLDIEGSSDELLSSFKSKLRSQIKKSEKNGLVFNWENEHKLDRFYTVFSQNMKDLGSPVHSKRWFQAVQDSYGENAAIGLVELEGQPVGCCLILMTDTNLAIPWASTLRQYNRLAPNMLLYWNILKYACDNGYKQVDFGRSSQDQGTYRFKTQWGAKPKDLAWYTITDNGNTKSESGLMGYRRVAESAWQKLPLTAANYIGPLVRKYISL